MFSSTGRVVGRSSKSNSPGNARDVKGCCPLVEGTNRPTGLHMYCGGRVPHGMHLATPTYCVRAQDTLPYAGVVSSSASLAAGQTRQRRTFLWYLSSCDATTLVAYTSGCGGTYAPARAREETTPPRRPKG
jgi:hypothetical protein